MTQGQTHGSESGIPTLEPRALNHFLAQLWSEAHLAGSALQFTTLHT